MTISIITLGRPLAITAAAATMLTLAACSGSDEPAATPSPASTSSVSAPAEPTPSLSESASSNASPSASASTSSGSPAQGNDALLAAGALAAGEIPDGTVVSIEAERNGWEVHVVSADGAEQQLRTDATGSQLTAGPTDDHPDAEDQADNRQFAQVDIGYQRAVRIIEREVADGQITELSLDIENRRPVWEADVSAGSQQRSVQIDATTGDVISNRVDD